MLLCVGSGSYCKAKHKCEQTAPPARCDQNMLNGNLVDRMRAMLGADGRARANKGPKVDWSVTLQKLQLAKQTYILLEKRSYS